MSPTPAPRSIPERLLRRLWISQSFTSSGPSSELKTADDRPLKIIFPGKPNRNSGPDFTGARIRVGEVLYTGDIELHRHCEDWRRHRHHRDPRYNSVILHVVFNGEAGRLSTRTSSGRTIPLLILGDYIDASVRRGLRTAGSGRQSERVAPIRCRGLNGAVGSAIVRRWLEKLASERIDHKIRRFEERLKELTDNRSLRVHERPASYDDLPFGLNPEELPPPGREGSARHFGMLVDWEQLMYEGIMEALGYENNRDPFLRLARNLKFQIIAQRLIPPASCDPALILEAGLFRISGLLNAPWETSGTETRRYMRTLRNIWKLSGNCYAGEYLSSAEWQFFRMRPENFPTLRLAGAARILPRLIRKNSFRHILQIVRGDVLPVRERYSVLEQLFVVQADGFWATHYRPGERANKPLTTLIGKGRAAEIVVNGVIPICLLYARIFRDQLLREGGLALLQHCPPGVDNSSTSTITEQLTGDKFALSSAVLQQGALQLYRFYCTEERCPECAVGKIVFK